MSDKQETTGNIFDYFDLEAVGNDIQEDFLEDLGEVMMSSLLQKAWSELGSEKREALTTLLEKSAESPEDEKKKEAVFSFLNENIVDIEEYIKQEIENLESIYKKNRDILRDSTG